jgi:PilZ domain
MIVHHRCSAFMNRTLSRPGGILERCSDPATVFVQAIAVLGIADPRSTTRVRCRGSVFCHPVALRRTRSWQAVVHDLSLTGIGLLSAEIFEPGKVLAVSLPRALNDVPQPLLMTVVHAGVAASGLCRMGGKWSRPLTPAQLWACLQILQSGR